MRKSATLILLFILLFNMIGYRVWFYYAERKADAAMEARLDRDQYDENELVSLTVPLDNPYQLEQKSFQRVDGEISFGGKTLKYVKRKVSNGNLILLCIPDTHKMILKKAKADYGNASNDLAGNGKNTPPNGSQKNYSGSDYINQCANLQMFKWADASLKHNTFFLVNFSDPNIVSPGKPPQPIMA